MKTIKHLFTALFLLCTTVVTAHNFEVDGIYYNITNTTNKTVAVTNIRIYPILQAGLQKQIADSSAWDFSTPPPISLLASLRRLAIKK